MFKFFTEKMVCLEYCWIYFYTCLYLVPSSIDVKINEWFGDFYDTLQKALTEPGSVSEEGYRLFIHVC